MRISGPPISHYTRLKLNPDCASRANELPTACSTCPSPPTSLSMSRVVLAEQHLLPTVTRGSLWRSRLGGTSSRLGSCLGAWLSTCQRTKFIGESNFLVVRKSAQDSISSDLLAEKKTGSVRMHRVGTLGRSVGRDRDCSVGSLPMLWCIICSYNLSKAPHPHCWRLVSFAILPIPQLRFPPLLVIL